MFEVAALLVFLICAGNKFQVAETSGCAWEVAITTTLRPCTNTSLKLTDYHNPEAIKAILSAHTMITLKWRISFLGKIEPFEQSLLARIKCKTAEEGRARSRMHALTGGKVRIVLQHRALFGMSLSGDQYFSKHYSAAMIDIGDTPGCDSYGKCPHGALCDPVWVVPLQHDNHVLSISGKMENEGFGQLVPLPQRFIADLSGLMPNASSETTRDLTSLRTAVVPLIHMPHASSFVILGGFDDVSTLLLSETEFEDVVISHLEAVYPEVSQGESVCDCDAPHGRPHMYATGSLSDRHLLLTSIGLVEVYGMLAYMNSGSLYNSDHPRGNRTSHLRLSLKKPKSVVAFKRCAHKMILPAQDLTFYQYVLLTGACQDEGRLFVARIWAKTSSSLKFNELLLPDESLLGSMFPAPSRIIATAQSAISGGRFFALLETNQFGSPVYAVTMTRGSETTVNMTSGPSGATSSELLTLIPQQVPSRYDLDEPLMLTPALLSDHNPTEKLVLRGISATARLTHHLFLWGSRILHSHDLGKTFYLLPVHAPDEVLLFETSRRGQMVFLTARQEIFAGVTEISKVTKIWPSDTWHKIHTRLNLPTLPADVHIITVFFDKYDKINLLYVSTSSPSTVLKHTVPLADILTTMAFDEQWERQNYILDAQGYDEKFLKMPAPCPFHLIIFTFADIKRYTKLQEVLYYPPFVTHEGKAYWHSNASLLFYHSIIKNMTSYMDGFHFETYTSTSVSPIERWKEIQGNKQQLFKYLYQTKRLAKPGYLHTDHVQLVRALQLVQPRTMETTELPDIIYLDFNDSFHFTMIVAPSENDKEKLHLGVHVTNGSLIGVEVTKHWHVFKDIMTYEVVIHHKAWLGEQTRPGTGLHEESVQLFFHDAPIRCYVESEKYAEPQGMQHLSVMLGCPPNLHVQFDWNATKQKLYDESIQQTPIDCLYPDPTLPCFYFDNGFYPIFRVFDDTLFQSWVFEGNYTLKVIGGSPEFETMRNYTQEEIFAYNNKHGKDVSLIWSGNDDIVTEDGWNMYSMENNGIRWLCQPRSPCSGGKPKFPSTPEFFLLIQFTNRAVDSHRTNCDFTFTFIVHLHGLPIDAVSTSLVILGITVGLIVMYLFVYFILYCRRGVFYKQVLIYYHTRLKSVFQKTKPEVYEKAETTYNLNRKISQ